MVLMQRFFGFGSKDRLSSLFELLLLLPLLLLVLLHPFQEKMGKPRLRTAKVKPLKKPTRRLFRIVYNDPDATESSGDEGKGSGSGGDVSRPKRKVQEFPFAARPPKNVALASTRIASSSSLSGKRKHRGVRLRPSGRWSAEIWCPVNKERIWLGTFPTESKAVEAYRRAAPRRLQDKKGACCSAGSSGDGFLSTSLPPLDELDPSSLNGQDGGRTGGIETVSLQDAFGLGLDSFFLQGELGGEFWPGSVSLPHEWASTSEIEEIFAN
ncbi:Ethylene-responsive transcription factor CRF4 [Apostasia shenzhenica]|uniref:Ethylene-responsive transcription factor CRF4 n=1 Tax=Apostasia shenzhenica TaxID=1088818 RepID=A0A2I0B8A7_9ASPA|nr:Ethylene-responsive transcription factor CRF4 [Apostasia shenzhenica]